MGPKLVDYLLYEPEDTGICMELCSDVLDKDVNTPMTNIRARANPKEPTIQDVRAKAATDRPDIMLPPRIRRPRDPRSPLVANQTLVAREPIPPTPISKPCPLPPTCRTSTEKTGINGM